MGGEREICQDETHRQLFNSTISHGTGFTGLSVSILSSFFICTAIVLPSSCLSVIKLYLEHSGGH